MQLAADDMGNEDLKARVNEFISKNLADVTNSDGWRRLVESGHTLPPCFRED